MHVKPYSEQSVWLNMLEDPEGSSRFITILSVKRVTLVVLNLY
jgi:hypothetical protein